MDTWRIQRPYTEEIMTPKILLNYLGGMTFENTHSITGVQILSDVPVDETTQGKGYLPGEMLVAALASWAGSTVALYGLKNSLDLMGMAVEGTLDHDEKSNITKITITFTMPPLSYREKDKKVMVKYAHVCPVGKMLVEGLKEFIFIWPDSE